jgi:hypothetical protein
MAGPQIRESVTVAVRAERARVARAFVGGVLGPGHPCEDDAALLVSELFGNSVRHSRSGAAGGTAFRLLVPSPVGPGDGLRRGAQASRPMTGARVGAGAACGGNVRYRTYSARHDRTAVVLRRNGDHGS